MKKLLDLSNGTLHEVADTTDWGTGFSEVQTFRANGSEWIKYYGGKCPVPHLPGEVMFARLNGADWQRSICETHQLSTIFERDNRIHAFRVISTPPQPSGYEMSGNPDKYRPKPDDREPSPQEHQYAAKVEAGIPQAQPPKSMPSIALKDIDYNPKLMGVAQFIASGEQ